jgi:hypothetical protein
VEEQQLVSPKWQRARSHITRCSKIPDLQKHYSDSPLPPFAWPRPLRIFPIPQDEITAERASFDKTEEIHAESQEVIDTFTFENFQGCMKSWRTCWERCILPKGTTLKETVETRIYGKKLFLWSKSPNFWVAPRTLAPTLVGVATAIYLTSKVKSPRNMPNRLWEGIFAIDLFIHSAMPAEGDELINPTHFNWQVKSLL